LLPAAPGPHATTPTRRARSNSLDTKPFAPAAAKFGVRSAEERPSCRRPQRRPSGGHRSGQRQPIATGEHHPLLFQKPRKIWPHNGGFSRGALARRLPLRLVSFSPRLCAASGVTAQAVGCKRCWVADCGVYGLLLPTSNPLVLSCAWSTCHRAIPSCPPEQPRHQTFRTRGGEAWHPQRTRRSPVAAGRSAAHQVDTVTDSANPSRPANITLFSFKNRGRSGHTTLASAAARLARRLHLRL
jgi:hypothetical protein